MRACDFAVRAKQCCVGAFWTSSMAMSRTCRQRQQQRASNRQLWSEIQHLLVRDILVDLSSFDDKCLVGEAVGEEEQAASAREPERAVEEGVGEHPTRSHPPPVAQHHLPTHLLDTACSTEVAAAQSTRELWRTEPSLGALDFVGGGVDKDWPSPSGAKGDSSVAVLVIDFNANTRMGVEEHRQLIAMHVACWREEPLPTGWS